MEIIIIIKYTPSNFEISSLLSPYGQNLKAPYYQLLIYFGNHSLILKEEKKALAFKQNAIPSEIQKSVNAT